MAAARWRAANPEKKMLLMARQRARAEGLPFDLELVDIVIPETCPVLGTPMHKPSLDQVIPRGGYTKKNTWVISMEANRLKQNATVEQLELIIAYMKREGEIAPPPTVTAPI